MTKKNISLSVSSSGEDLILHSSLNVKVSVFFLAMEDVTQVSKGLDQFF